MVNTLFLIFMKIVSILLTVISFILFSCLSAFSDTGNEKSGDKKNILYINSYHNGYQWSDEILNGIRSGLMNSDYKIDLQIEYMDAKKFYVQPVVDNLLTLYKEKFNKEKFDAVLVSDDDAFNFALEYRDQLFKGVPIIFCGINDLDLNDVHHGNLTGVVENFDLAGTIRIALNLHPRKTRMVVIGDNSTAGKAIKQQIEELVPAFRDRIKVDYWTQLDLEEVQNRVERLSHDTFLFFIPYYQVIGNKFYTAEEMIHAIYLHSTVPIYTAWGFLLGNGAVGGSLLSGYEHGQEAAKMALEILDGKSPDDIPISYIPVSVNRFDYKVMQRLSISEKKLPKGSQLINAPNPFYELPRELFWTIIVSFILLLITVVFLIFNMIARKQVEQKMKNQLTFQETLIDTIPQLVSWKNHRYQYVGANLTFANFFGLKSISDVVDQTTDAVIHDKNYVRWSLDADTSVVTGKTEFRKERKKYIHPETQEESLLEVNKVPLRDQNGKINGVLTTAENVTKERNLEKQLLQSQKMEAIGTLASGISHDFNNILTSTINSIELAMGDVEEDSQTYKDLERGLKAARRGGRVVKQILSFSKPTQEGFRSTDLAAVISEVLHFMEVSLPGNITIRSHISPGIGSIYADPTQLHQAVMNLYTNAFHVLREKGGELSIRLEEVTLNSEEAKYLNLTKGKYVKLTVEDNGPGIPPDIIDKIFDPFFSSKDKSEGTGLGLAVVHGIVKGHQGGLKVKSEVGTGTIFEIYLPKIATNAIITDKNVDTHKTQHAKILLVEDDEDQLITIPRLLESIGHQVTAIGNSKIAAETIINNPQQFDLLITDYDMPLMNGVELVNQIKQWAPKLPVLMISGREEASNSARNTQMIKRVFIKPYSKEELFDAVNQVLQGR